MQFVLPYGIWHIYSRAAPCWGTHPSDGSVRAHMVLVSSPGSTSEQTLPFSEVSQRKTCLLRFDPRLSSVSHCIKSFWARSSAWLLRTQPTAAHPASPAQVPPDIPHQPRADHQHHSSSWLNWCQRNDTAVSNTGEETFHSIFNAYPLSKQAINDMLTLRKLSWYSILSPTILLLPLKLTCRSTKGKSLMPNLQVSLS